MNLSEGYISILCIFILATFLKFWKIFPYKYLNERKIYHWLLIVSQWYGIEPSGFALSQTAGLGPQLETARFPKQRWKNKTTLLPCAQKTSKPAARLHVRLTNPTKVTPTKNLTKPLGMSLLDLIRIKAIKILSIS